MKNRHDDLLRTNAWQHPIDKISVGRYHISAPAAADTDGILTATKRTSTTAWAASSCTVKADSAETDTLTVKAPTMMGAKPNDKIKIDLKTSSSDALSVYIDDDNEDTIVIELAKTTANKNTATLIQAAIRALGTVNGIDVSKFTCVAGGNWNTEAIATGETEAKAFADGATGDYGIITEGIKQPAEPRNITATAGGTTGDIANVAVKIVGTDFNDEPIEEELPYFTADSAGTVAGSKAFKTVTEIWLPAHDGADATTEIGFGKLFGLPYKLTNKFIQVAFNGTWETSAPTIAIDEDVLSNNTIQIANADNLDGEKDVDIFIYL